MNSRFPAQPEPKYWLSEVAMSVFVSWLYRFMKQSFVLGLRLPVEKFVVNTASEPILPGTAGVKTWEPTTLGAHPLLQPVPVGADTDPSVCRTRTGAASAIVLTLQIPKTRRNVAKLTHLLEDDGNALDKSP